MAHPLSAQHFPSLPEPVSNNAVVSINVGPEQYLVSFMGLGGNKTWQDVHNKTWILKKGQDRWQPGSPVPSSLPLKGRLASIAVAVDGKAYVFGGYTVAEDHTEISSPDNFRYDVIQDRFEPIANTPVPTDDAVALVYQQRYVYLISGWHNDGNVNLVQVYDIKTDSWTQASPFLGHAVFGHAGAIVDNKMLVCDGVKVVARASQRRTFAAEPACYLGAISDQDMTRIDWRIVPHPTGTARYRMASTGLDTSGTMVFYGGSDNPYNYNGIGYNGQASEPDPAIWLYDVSDGKWTVKASDNATMDHRSLVEFDGKLVVVGGMGPKQTSLSTTRALTISTED